MKAEWVKGQENHNADVQAIITIVLLKTKAVDDCDDYDYDDGGGGGGGGGDNSLLW